MKHQKYEKYKDSGIEWLGIIPDSWKISKCNFEYDIQLGKMLQPEPTSEGDIKVPYLKALHIQWHKVRYSQLPEMWASNFEIEKYKASKQDLLVCEGGEVGRAATLMHEEENLIIQNALHRVRSRNSNSTKFLEYLLNNIAAQDWFSIISNKATIAHFTREKFGALRIPMPSVLEQQAIADFLDKEVSIIDTLITKKQQFIERLKEKRLALISFTVTKGINGNEELKQSGILWVDQIPPQWKTGKLKWYSLIYSGGTPDKTIDEYWEEGTVPWINSGAVNQRLITTPSAFITQEAFLKSSAKWIPQNALVMALAGQGKTKGMVAQLAIKTTCNQSMAAIIPNNKLNPRYLLFWLEINYQNIRNLAGGDQRDGLNLSMIGSIECIIPPLEEQNAIVELIDRLDIKHEAIITKTNEAVQKLQEYKTALISAAVTGKIKVTDQV